MTKEEAEASRYTHQVLDSIKPQVYKCAYCGKYIEGKIPAEVHRNQHLWTATQVSIPGKTKPKAVPKPKVPIKAAEELKRLLKSKANQ